MTEIFDMKYLELLIEVDKRLKKLQEQLTYIEKVNYP